MKNHINFVLGLVILLLAGFAAFVTAIGWTIVMIAVFNVLPWWHIAIGTVVSAGVVVMHLKKKEL